MSNKNEPDVFVNIDDAIERHNKENPKKDPLSRKDVFNETGITKATLQNWKKGKVPKAFKDLISIIDVTGVPFNKLVKAERNGKSII